MKNTPHNVEKQELNKDIKTFLEKNISNDLDRIKTENLLSSSSPITEFRKIEINDKKYANHVSCTLEDGTNHIIPVDCTLQLFFDKMDMHPDVKVDFSVVQAAEVQAAVDKLQADAVKADIDESQAADAVKTAIDKSQVAEVKTAVDESQVDAVEKNLDQATTDEVALDRVEIFPYQNKIVLISGETNQVVKTADIDSSLMYSETDSITGKSKISFFSNKLNPAILSLLDDNKSAQDDYANVTGNLDIIYNFEEKSDSFSENASNKDIVKKMNEYYNSEKEYVKELQVKGRLAPNIEISKKVGYAGFMDKLHNSRNKKKERQSSPELERISSYKQAREELLKSVKYNTTPINIDKSKNEQTIRPKNEIIIE